MDKSLSSDSLRSTAVEEPNLQWTRQRVEDALRGLNYGSILLHVQDGLVVQIERTERKRYQRSA